MAQYSPSRKRPTALRIALALILFAALAYQLRYTEYRYPWWFRGHEVVQYPFNVLAKSTEPGFRIGFLRPEAKNAGLREDDTLLALDGKPVAGTGVFGEAIIKARPGQVWKVTVRPKESDHRSAERTVDLTLAHAGFIRAGGWLRIFPLLLFVVMPAFCLLLGFWVSAVRPLDPRAWILLALMLCFAAFFNAGTESWGPGVRDLATVYQSVVKNTWSIWLLLFGIYFPEPFPKESWWARWQWLKWLIVLPVLLDVAAETVVAVGVIENYAAVFPLNNAVARFDRLDAVIRWAAVATFFTCLGAKWRLAVSLDTKRRLRLLFAGALLSLGPVITLVAIAAIRNAEMELYFPGWLVGAAWLLFFLFPATLAYVIAVQRAMDVRMVIRQGLQYAFATNGIRVLQLAFGFVSVFVIVSLLGHVWQNRILSGTIIVVATTLAFVVRRLFTRLRTWTDRRFFRDAYNAEQILSDLSDKVRTIVEIGPLLETVSRRIAESLHVPQVAVLIDGSGPYRPAYVFGYNSVPEVVFPETGGTVRQLQKHREPARVYLDDPGSWVYRSEITEEDRAKLVALQTELLLPLSVKDKLLGFISLGQKRSEEPYSGPDLRLLQSVAAQTGLALEVARLTSAIGEEIAQRERLNREVEIAREVQERLFPQELPPVPGLDHFGACRPALGVGGDYYDFLQLPDGRLGIAIGDVSGKGISASLMMASLQASLRGQTMIAPGDLATVITRVNRLVYDATSANRYATFFYAEYEPKTRQLAYVNAGHNPPMLFRKSHGEWQVTRLDVGGTVIGLLKHFPYQQATLALQPADLLVGFTDGITETMNHADEEWGEDELIKTVQACEGLKVSEIIARTMSAADAFAAGAEQHDDMTLVVLRVVSQADQADL